MNVLAENAGSLTFTAGQIMWFAMGVAGVAVAALALVLRTISNIADKRNDILKEIGANRTETLLQGQRITALEADHQAIRATLHSINNGLMSLNVGVAKITTKMDLEEKEGQ